MRAPRQRPGRRFTDARLPETRRGATNSSGGEWNSKTRPVYQVFSSAGKRCKLGEVRNISPARLRELRGELA